MVPGSWIRVYGVKHVNIRLAEKFGRVIVAEDSGTLMGWLWWNLFRDNMLFMKES